MIARGANGVRNDAGSIGVADCQANGECFVIVCFEPGDRENPYNWSKPRKTFVLLTGMLAVLNSTLGSALPSGAASYIGASFGISSTPQLTLLVSAYLIGYVLGPLAFGPISEAFGRRPVTVLTFVGYVIFTAACAVSRDFPSLIVFRLLAGVFASSPITVIGGIYADIYSDPETRGRAMAFFMAATTFGPNLGPLISGFISPISWRWAFYVALIFAGVNLPLVIMLPETYGPVLLLKRAKLLRKKHQTDRYKAPLEFETSSLHDVVTRVLTRPLRMLVLESIVLFSCLYLALIYSIFYLFFEAYPIIFQGMYGLSNGIAGLAFMPIAVGALFSLVIFLAYDSILRRAQAQRRPWSFREEHRRLPLAVLGGPLFAIPLFWLGWAASPSVHPVVPIMAGLPLGMGFLLLFMALINYLTDAYETYAASAMAASSFSRSISGAVLPLAAGPMYARLGVHWATSLLGFVAAVMALIPFAFIRYGDRLRESSKFSREIKEKKEAERRRMGLARNGPAAGDSGQASPSDSCRADSPGRADTHVKEAFRIDAALDEETMKEVSLHRPPEGPGGGQKHGLDDEKAVETVAYHANENRRATR